MRKILVTGGADKDKISVIIPVYNGARFIKEALESVLSQTFPVFEILVIDDGSTDNTKEIVISIPDKRIKYIWQEHQGVPASPRNTGLRIAKGDYIAFLDQDDIWLPHKLEKQMEIFKKNPDILVVSTNGYIFNQDRKGKRQMFNLFFNKKISFKDMLTGCWVLNSSVLMKQKVIKLVGFIDENPQIIGADDYDYWLRILNYKDKSIIAMKDKLIKYRFHQSNLSTSDILPHEERIKIIYSKYKEYDYIKGSIAYQKRIRVSIITEKVYKGEIKVKDLLLNVREIGIVIKIIILIKHFVYRRFPVLRRFYWYYYKSKKDL